MLTSGPPVPSGPAGSAWDVMAWTSHTKPCSTRDHHRASGRETASSTNSNSDLGHNSSLYTWNVPKSCSMELCALGGYGSSLKQGNPALELPLVQRLLSAAVAFSALLYPEPDSTERAKLAQWADILDHLAMLPLTTTVVAAPHDAGAAVAAGQTQWVWAEANIPSSAVFGANSWYPLDYYSPMHPGNGVGIRTRQSDPETFALARRTVAALNNATAWNPESGAQMDWIAAVRLGWNATEFILRSGAALGPSAGSRYPMLPSFYGTDGGMQTNRPTTLRATPIQCSYTTSRRRSADYARTRRQR